MKWIGNGQHADPWKALLAGLAGGAAGSLVSAAMEAALARLQPAHERQVSQFSRLAVLGQPPGCHHIQLMTHPAASASAGVRELRQMERDSLAEAESWRPPGGRAMAAVGQRIGMSAELGRPVMHVALGTTLGALYGLAAEYAPEVRFGRGAALGATMYAATDAGALPALGLAPAPAQAPASAHAAGLSADLMFGLTCEFVREQVRDWLE